VFSYATNTQACLRASCRYDKLWHESAVC